MKAPRILVYARVSTADKNQKPEAQINELRRYCEARGWNIAREIIDKGHSGSTDNRPGLKALMTLARRREVDTVVVVKLDRLFRSLKHLVTTLDEFQALGICFIAIKDSFDYSTPSGRLLAGILGSLAEFEKALLIERTLIGLEYARSQGKCLGRPKERDDDAILSLRAQGLSYTEIENKLSVSRGAIYRAIKGVSKTSENPLQKTL
jgi:DNA invertase Pin-like site-specific DNA recombinase